MHEKNEERKKEKNSKYELSILNVQIYTINACT